LIVNVPNARGYVGGLPPEIAVEVPARVSGSGVEPLATTPLPPALVAHALRDYVAPVLLELEAFETGSRERLLDLIATDPWTRSERMAVELLDSIMPRSGGR